MFGLTIWSILMSTSEIIYLGWKTIKHIYKRNVSITVYGQEITPHRRIRVATIASALYSMNRDFGTAFYGDPMNQDLRLNLPIESCLLQFVIKNKKMTEEEKVKMREKEEEVNEDEELDDLEDDYAYYYGEDEDDSSGSSEDDDDDFDFGGDSSGIDFGGD